jgi:hypothetical protein
VNYRWISGNETEGVWKGRTTNLRGQPLSDVIYIRQRGLTVQCFSVALELGGELPGYGYLAFDAVEIDSLTGFTLLCDACGTPANEENQSRHFPPRSRSLPASCRGYAAAT